MLNQAIIESYVPILLLLAIALGLGTVIIFLPIITGLKRSYKDKNSQYECGFKGFGDVRKQFDVRFYLIAMLFMIFDVEISFLFPWAITLKDIGTEGFASMMIFIFVLTIGFVYEWKKGALDI